MKYALPVIVNRSSTDRKNKSIIFVAPLKSFYTSIRTNGEETVHNDKKKCVIIIFFPFSICLFLENSIIQLQNAHNSQSLFDTEIPKETDIIHET